MINHFGFEKEEVKTTDLRSIGHLVLRLAEQQPRERVDLDAEPRGQEHQRVAASRRRFGSIHSTGLALQALIAAEEPGTETVKGRAMTNLLMNQDWQGTYGNELDNYYVVPALNMKSLASIHDRKCRPHTHDTQGTEGVYSQAENPKPTIVHYSLWIGGSKNEIQTITLAMPKHANFLEVMEAAQKLNPHFVSYFHQ
ncbi:uncharacterized protein CEXT_523791 [Caerostris extrusa]|uniref:Uncharacterized protein n=1 Tax=Caerostris extrusa TaxID=172846 RepID=A0AAV4T6J6_CAEEX|nr:uncharacterized protein CEXT_523791 [Caerostris extrusa]